MNDWKLAAQSFDGVDPFFCIRRNYCFWGGKGCITFRFLLTGYFSVHGGGFFSCIFKFVSRWQWKFNFCGGLKTTSGDFLWMVWCGFFLLSLLLFLISLGNSNCLQKSFSEGYIVYYEISIFRVAHPHYFFWMMTTNFFQCHRRPDDDSGNSFLEMQLFDRQSTVAQFWLSESPQELISFAKAVWIFKKMLRVGVIPRNSQLGTLT